MLFNDLMKQPELSYILNNTPKNETEGKSCLLNKEKLEIREFILNTVTSILIALQQNNCPPTLSKCVLNSYFILDVF